MIKVSVSKIKTHFSEYLNRAVDGKERVVITSRGKPKAVIIGIEEMERLEALESAEAEAPIDTTTAPTTAQPDLGRQPYSRQDIASRNQRLLELLQGYASAPDEAGEAWWDEFERDLRKNRLTFREIEFDE